MVVTEGVGEIRKNLVEHTSWVLQVVPFMVAKVPQDSWIIGRNPCVKFIKENSRRIVVGNHFFAFITFQQRKHSLTSYDKNGLD